MSTSFYDPGVGEHVVIDGSIVERRTLYLVEKIKDLYPEVEVLAVDPDQTDSPWEEPYQICHWVNGRLLKIFGCWELNDSVLERLRLADSHENDVQKMVDDHNAKVKKDKEAKQQERSDERADLISSIAANRTSNYSMRTDEGDLLTFHEDKPATKKSV